MPPENAQRLFALCIILLVTASACIAETKGGEDAADGESACEAIPSPETIGIHASPTGSPDAAGTLEAPMDLATALSSSGPAAPGDTVWLAAGTYAGVYTADLSGTAAYPITVRPLPGARVTLDSNVGVDEAAGLTVNGQWTIIQGLEVASSDPVRETEDDTGADITLLAGIAVYGSNVSIVNCAIHDTEQGIAFKIDAVDSEVYGNVIYNNGWSAPGRGHGPAIVTQNETGTKRIELNTIFFGFGNGIYGYTESGSIQGFDIIDNVWFHTGASDSRTSQRKDNFLLGGLQPVARLNMTGNLGWSRGRGTQLGYSGDVHSLDATLTGNVFAESVSFAGTWEALEIADNVFYDGLDGLDPAEFPDNDFQDEAPTSGTQVFVQANRYDVGSARVAIYNFDQAPHVTVDMSTVLQTGEAYTVHSVYDLWGSPVLEGTYDGEALAFPMGTVAPPQPNGLPDGIADDDDPERVFGTFIVTHTGCL